MNGGGFLSSSCLSLMSLYPLSYLDFVISDVIDKGGAYPQYCTVVRSMVLPSKTLLFLELVLLFIGRQGLLGISQLFFFHPPLLR